MELPFWTFLEGKAFNWHGFVLSFGFSSFMEPHVLEVSPCCLSEGPLVGTDDICQTHPLSLRRHGVFPLFLAELGCCAFVWTDVSAVDTLEWDGWMVR